MSYKGQLTIYVDTIRKMLSTLLRGHNTNINTLRTGSFKLLQRPFPGFLTILTL